MKRVLYPLLCVLGGLCIGFFAGHLDTVYGAVMFVLGVTAVVFAGLWLCGASMKMKPKK